MELTPVATLNILQGARRQIKAYAHHVTVHTVQDAPRVQLAVALRATVLRQKQILAVAISTC